MTARSSFLFLRPKNSQAAIPVYPCCTSRGSVVALDANTGKQIWKAWVVPGDPKPVKTMTNGVTIWAPGGGAVWDTPTIEPVRNAIYFGTGDATTAPSPKTTDGIMAVDLKTGDMLWAFQADENDVFMGGCNARHRSDACPNPMGRISISAFRRSSRPCPTGSAC